MPILKQQVGGCFMQWTVANEKALAEGKEEFSVHLGDKLWIQKPQKYHARSLVALRAKYAAAADKAALDPILDEAGCRAGLARNAPGAASTERADDPDFTGKEIDMIRSSLLGLTVLIIATTTSPGAARAAGAAPAATTLAAFEPFAGWGRSGGSNGGSFDRFGFGLCGRNIIFHGKI